MLEAFNLPNATNATASGCIWLFSSGRTEFFDAGSSAAALAVVAAAFATTAGIGLQVRLSRATESERSPVNYSLLPLIAALTTALIAAVVNANLAGSRACEVAAAGICYSTEILGVSALLLLCAIGWLVAEHTSNYPSQIRTHPQIFIGGILLAMCLAAPLLLALGLGYTEYVVFGHDLSMSEYVALILPSEAAVLVVACARIYIASKPPEWLPKVGIISVKGFQCRGKPLEWFPRMRSSTVRFSVGMFLGGAAVLMMIIGYLVTVRLNPDQIRQLSDVFPSWLIPFAMVSLVLITFVVIGTFPMSSAVSDDGRRQRAVPVVSTEPGQP